ncbi:MAG TPA: translation initiation factor IF-3 [Pseudothermotoga sp.]|uniref:translation initiation factor IF-3 n=1 Tax=Thermotoga profunda TaxID=1508420 RepID=UPI0009E5A883|nr:translation initiation factor IF-3 [Thermotoga profunda]
MPAIFYREVGSIEKEQVLLKNEQIRHPKVRVIDSDGKQIGVISTKEAIELARRKGLDLVLVSPNSDPPVAKIMDFGKYMYQISKRQKEAKKKQKIQETKQMKFRLKIDEHDYQTKLKHIRRFLEDGDKVKVTIMFRGREIAFADRGKQILDRIANDLNDIAVVEADAKLEGRDMWMQLKPKNG